MMGFRLGFTKEDEPIWFNLNQVTHISKGVDTGFFRIENALDPDSYSKVLYLRLPKPNELKDSHFIEMTRFWNGKEIEWL